MWAANYLLNLVANILTLYLNHSILTTGDKSDSLTSVIKDKTDSQQN